MMKFLIFFSVQKQTGVTSVLLKLLFVYIDVITLHTRFMMIDNVSFLFYNDVVHFCYLRSLHTEIVMSSTCI